MTPIRERQNVAFYRSMSEFSKSFQYESVEMLHFIDQGASSLNHSHTRVSPMLDFLNQEASYPNDPHTGVSKCWVLQMKERVLKMIPVRECPNVAFYRPRSELYKSFPYESVKMLHFIHQGASSLNHSHTRVSKCCILQINERVL